MSTLTPHSISPRFLGAFLDVLQTEVGYESLEMVLAKANLPTEIANPQTVNQLSNVAAAENFASVQRALRTFYGRGARGTLIRIGRLVWHHLQESVSFSEKAQIQMVRAMPISLRRKATLDLLVRLLRIQADGVTTHTLDLDLMLVDRYSTQAVQPKERAPICFVTIGLIQEALYWATSKEHDVEETGCRAAGNNACEFKIKMLE